LVRPNVYERRVNRNKPDSRCQPFHALLDGYEGRVVVLPKWPPSGVKPITDLQGLATGLTGNPVGEICMNTDA